MPERRIVQTVYDWRIRANLICIILAVILAGPTRLSLLAGTGFMILGLLLRGWAAGHLMKEKELTVSGPYRFTRNPLYMGSLVIGIGVFAAARSWWVFGLFMLNFLIFYPVAVRVEKRRMQHYFPDAYREYSRHVPLFLPALRPYTKAVERPFSWALFRRNKELRAPLGAVVFLAFLIGRMLLF